MRACGVGDVSADGVDFVSSLRYASTADAEGEDLDLYFCLFCSSGVTVLP
ncbi:hypothetical protein RchiOBHm_Chr5g0072141 [Rosa chinensis]|uniref:Uncharacterized protein n=1 Tax=Rosa chinensis TaxID=74649 RepID=A0A2P6QKL3_ROSCH|nr:hypothetical protein RchiOBHm_Chr5g0072141 [Rosa chinensis]